MHPAKHRCLTATPLRSSAVRRLRLVIEIRKEPVVDGLPLWPRPNTGAVIGSQPPYDIDVGLDAVLPRLSLATHQLQNAVAR